MDPWTSKVLQMIYKTYTTTKCDSVRAGVGTGYHIHCHSLNKQFSKALLYWDRNC